MPLASYEELRKVDIKKYCKKRDGLDYLNWATCINLLRMHGADKSSSGGRKIMRRKKLRWKASYIVELLMAVMA